MDPNEVIRLLQGHTVITSQGTFVPMDKVKELLEMKADAAKEDEDAPKPKTLSDASLMARLDLKGKLPKATMSGLGRSLPATLNDPPSAVEGVKA